jgi:hypothetical protein
LLALVAGSLLAQDRTAQLRSRFEKETDPVRKARMVTLLADSEFREMHQKIDTGDLAGAAAPRRTPTATSNWKFRCANPCGGWTISW